MMKEERRRSRDDDVAPFSKKKRMDESPLQNQISTPKSRGHVPMSERQQFALLRQMECEEGSDRSQSSFPAGSVLHNEWGISGGHLHYKTDDTGGTVDSYVSGPLGAHEQLTENQKLESSASPAGASHRGSVRERPLSAVVVPTHCAGKSISMIRSKLFHLSKSNDLDSLKQLIKDGVNINEQDEHGRTALHEFSAQNLPRSVAYLLRHGAQPNIASLDGDTALHEAARAGFSRVVRTLLRHGADPLVPNSHGERPLDICQNSETLALLNQYVGVNRSHSSTIPMKSPTSIKSQRHHHNQLITGDQSHGTTAQRPPSCMSFLGVHEPCTYGKSCSTTTTPDCFSDSDDACSGSGLTPVTGVSVSSVVPLYSNENSVTPVISTSTTHSVSPRQKGSFAESHLMSYKPAKKDPYAFEDETDESPHPGTSFHPASAVHSGKSTSPSSRSRSFGPGSACGLCISSAISVSLNTNPTFVLSPSLPSCDFNVLTAGGQNGPPLRLRFAKEAGQYTLMENQQGSLVSEADEDIECIGAQPVTSFERKDQEVEQATTIISSEGSNIHRASDTVLSSIDNGEICGASTVRPASAQENTALDFNTDDGGSLQRVPPLRIKFASGASCDPDHLGPAISATDVPEMPSHSSPVGHHPNLDDVLNSHVPNRLVNSSCSDVPTSVNPINHQTICQETFDINSNTTRDNEMVTGELCDASVDSVSATRQLHSQLPVQLSEEFGEPQISCADGTADSTKELRHRGGRTLRSHTAAQREREVKERHANITPIKKRKLRSRNENADNAFSSTPSMQQGRTAYSNCTTSSTIVTNTSPMMTFGSEDHSDTSQIIVRTTDVTTKIDPTLQETVSSVKLEPVSPSHTMRVDNNPPSPSMRLSPESDGKMGALETKCKLAPVSSASIPTIAQTKVESASDESQKIDQLSTLTCPMGFDDDKRFPQLLEFENPYEKAAALQKKLRELVNSLVEVHPKAPSSYEQYLLVSRNYLLAYETPSLAKKLPPPDLNPVLASLFTEQEEERYAQALKHQSEREHLRLCAEQARLRAQTRAALANVSKPLSFCSVLGFTDLTYVPAVPKPEQRDEECAGDRFTQRTFIGWLEDIRDSFQVEKKKLLCRQLHEAESLMMVQRLDWEIKLKGCHMRDYSSDVFRNIPSSHVPLIHVPNDFPLFPNDPVLSVALV